MLDVLADLDPASVDAVVCDPPYGLAFMGKGWDHAVPGPDYWSACLRVLKPGGHLLAFGGTRTAHRLTSAIEDAGFEIRDMITWLYGSGFPKSLDVSKAIDKAAGATREVVGTKTFADGTTARRTQQLGTGVFNDPKSRDSNLVITAPATDSARQWQGWGTALKPASEPIIVARKPLGGTVAAAVLAHGTGALNIDGCRVATDEDTARSRAVVADTSAPFGRGMAMGGNGHAAGRWPANVVYTHAPDCGPEEQPGPCVDGCPVAELDAQTADLKGGVTVRRNLRGQEQNANGIYGSRGRDASEDVTYGDSGGASRFFPTFRYQAKAPTRERPKVDGVAHPTVKPLALMQWLVRLVTPPGGLVLDPFAGSGTTGEAALLEGMRAILVERDEQYLPLIAARLERAA